MSYFIDGPADISFSGGRTSGYLLHQILEAHHGTLPADVLVHFCNTGKELEETLRFVDECGRRWGVKIRWLEYSRKCLPAYRSEARAVATAKIRETCGRDYLPNRAIDEACYREVTFETASRKGEPFENLIDLKGLPNAVQRFCTADMKIYPAKRFMLAQGYEHWNNVIGLRADEPRRVANMRKPHSEPWDFVMPLVTAEVTKATVVDFWKKMPFDLALPVDANNETYQGNCDLCFLKSTAKRVRIMQENPERAGWWINQEKRANMRFLSSGKTYQDVLDQNVVVTDLDGLGDCVCTE